MGRNGFIDLEAQLKPLGFGRHGEKIPHGITQIRKVKFRNLQFRLSRLDARNIEDVGQQLGQPL